MTSLGNVAGPNVGVEPVEVSDSFGVLFEEFADFGIGVGEPLVRDFVLFFKQLGCGVGGAFHPAEVRCNVEGAVFFHWYEIGVDGDWKFF